jgi:hypothetical protein
MAFLNLEKSCGASMYPWPVGNFDYVMDEALDIAMNYLSRTDQAVNFRVVQTVAAKAIIASWQSGVRHKIRLASCAIRTVEANTTEPADNVLSVYPRVM